MAGSTPGLAPFVLGVIGFEYGPGRGNGAVGGADSVIVPATISIY